MYPNFFFIIKNISRLNDFIFRIGNFLSASSDRVENHFFAMQGR